jgi:HK97 family phage prohead protease
MHQTKRLNQSFRVFNAARLEVKAAGAGRIEGYASTFDLDGTGERILPGAFSKKLRNRAEPMKIPMLYEHSVQYLIGGWDKAFEDDHGLYVTGSLDLDAPGAKDVLQLLKAGDIKGLSIGAFVQADHRLNQANGEVHISELDLAEVSLTALPKNPNAMINQAKSLATRKDAVDMLRNSGLSKRAAERFAAGGYGALNSQIDDQKAMDLARLIDKKINQMRNS